MSYKNNLCSRLYVFVCVYVCILKIRHTYIRTVQLHLAVYKQMSVSGLQLTHIVNYIILVIVTTSGFSLFYCYSRIYRKILYYIYILKYVNGATQFKKYGKTSSSLILRSVCMFKI